MNGAAATVVLFCQSHTGMTRKKERKLNVAKMYYGRSERDRRKNNSLSGAGRRKNEYVRKYCEDNETSQLLPSFLHLVPLVQLHDNAFVGKHSFTVKRYTVRQLDYFRTMVMSMKQPKLNGEPEQTDDKAGSVRKLK